MLYFYCCELEASALDDKIKLSGFLELNRRIQKMEEIDKIKENIRQSIRLQISQKFPEANFEDATINFVAFNPL